MELDVEPLPALLAARAYRPSGLREGTVVMVLLDSGQLAAATRLACAFNASMHLHLLVLETSTSLITRPCRLSVTAVSNLSELATRLIKVAEEPCDLVIYLREYACRGHDCPDQEQEIVQLVTAMLLAPVIGLSRQEAAHGAWIAALPLEALARECRD